MKFPVWQTAVDVVDFLWRERRLLVRHGTLPFLLSLVIFVLAKGFGINLSQPQPADLPKGMLVALVQVVIFLPMTVTWYRLSVMGPAEGEHRPIFALGRLEGRLLLWQILLGLTVGGVAGLAIIPVVVVYAILNSMGLAGPATIVAGVLGVGVVIGALLVLARLSLVLVQAALDQPVNFKESWRMTNGVGWGIVGVLALLTLAIVTFNLLFALIAFIVGGIGAAASGSELEDFLIYFRMFGRSASGVLSGAAAATLMSFIYRILMTQAEQPARDQPV
jgi:hypothetical protein